jgi:hypothetical protein
MLPVIVDVPAVPGVVLVIEALVPPAMLVHDHGAVIVVVVMMPVACSEEQASGEHCGQSQRAQKNGMQVGFHELHLSGPRSDLTTGKFTDGGSSMARPAPISAQTPLSTKSRQRLCTPLAAPIARLPDRGVREPADRTTASQPESQMIARKTCQLVPLGSGVGLLACPYFVSNYSALLGICLFLAALPLVVRT